MKGRPLFLLVDDDPDDIMLLRDAVQFFDNNIQFAEAVNGRKAINYLNDAKLQDRLPDLIVLDINMPVLNGREVIAMINKDEQLKQIPLVVFSTSSHTGDLMYCKEHAVELIVKPFGMKLLMDIASGLVVKYAGNTKH
jgi:CheY-like chemotaxis protein